MTTADAPAVDLAPMWVPLLRRLTDTIPAWGLWKNADAALAGHGDFDSTAPSSDWAAITAAFQEWATEHGFGPATACHHVPGVLFLVAVDRANARLVELDVNARKYFRGWTMFRPEALAALMEIDERGFRRVRPGAEAVILLTQNGMRWGGRPDVPGLRRKRVADLLRSDPEGVAAAARLFGPARGALVRLAGRVERGGWSRPDALSVEAYAVARALAAPGILFTRVWAKRVKRRCPVLVSIFSNERRVPPDVDRWIEGVERDHVVLEAG
ncbi:MAG TPA: hypothetical protein VHK89_10805 [Actinomycetota bacterium]|nr:hypothetical protein [Actinomycetota bacterium]